MGRRTVITGASGMIGVELARQCTAAGEEVLAICHRGSAKNKVLQGLPGVEVLEADLDEYTALAGEPWAKQYDIFYHLAWVGTTGQARNDMALQTDNIHYTLDAVELAAHMGQKGKRTHAERVAYRIYPYGRFSYRCTKQF